MPWNVLYSPLTGASNTFVRPSVAAAILAGRAPTVTASSSFNANFATTSNPIDSSTYMLGLTDGVNWNNPQTTGGQAVAAAVPTTSRYADDICHVKPSVQSFNPDQWAQGTVFKASGYTGNGGSHELELLLRFQITNGNARGYELLWGIQGYIAVVRWNGAVGDFTAIYDPGVGSIATYNDGDILYGQIQGNLITAKKNGVTVANFPVDVTSLGGTVWNAGQPGFGFWPVDGALIASAGWKAYTAGNL